MGQDAKVHTRNASTPTGFTAQIIINLQSKTHAVYIVLPSLAIRTRYQLSSPYLIGRYVTTR